jgi:hypothetical protein
MTMTRQAPTEDRAAPPRRRLLAGVTAGLALIGSGLWQRAVAAAGRPVEVPAASVDVALLLQLAGHADAVPVGLAALPALGHPSRLALQAQLGARLTAVSYVAGTERLDLRRTDDLQRAFVQAVKADFGAGRCLQLGGWVLARTEVEVCALAALVSRRD